MFGWTNVLVSVFCSAVYSQDLLSSIEAVQQIPLADIVINGQQYRVEDQVSRLSDGSLFILRVILLTDISLDPVAAIPLQIPTGNRNITQLNTLLQPLNHSKVVESYIQAMIAAPFASRTLRLHGDRNKRNILCIGLGAGILNSFLHDRFDNFFITVVEIEQKMFELSKKYFDLTEDSRQRVVITDGVQYIRNKESNIKFDVIFIDACHNKNENGLICPTTSFTQKQNLKFVKRALTKNGMVVLSLLAFDSEKNKQIRITYRNVFGKCYLIDGFLNYANQVLVCGQNLIDKVTFGRNFRKTYKTFQFDGEPNVN